MSVRVLLLLTVALWGTTPMLEKLAQPGATPLNVLSIRTGFTAVCVAAAAGFTGQIGRPFTSTYPLITVVLSMLVLGEPITPAKAAGVALIVSGVMRLA